MQALVKFMFSLFLIFILNHAYSNSTISLKEEKNGSLPLNTDVRYGKLPNGLTYYIQQNNKPENRIEFRLVVNAGSNQEEINQKGLAHFVEHMAFNGSLHYSKNELVDYLESIGIKFGAHLNAYTSFDETVYMLQLPSDDKEILKKGFLVLEDWASGLSFDTTEINRERGVVFSEWRNGLGAGKRMMDKYLPVVYYKSRYAERLPIGDTAIILHTPYERLRSFYKSWYRPDLMAIVIVGNINLNEIEKEIKQRFSTLQNPENATKKEIYALPEHTKTLVSICTDPEATYSRAMVMYKHPSIDENSLDGYKKYLMNSLFNLMYNNRLQELLQQAEPPFIAAYSAYENETRANDAFSITAIANTGQTISALKTVLTENEKIKRYGFTQTEFERQKVELMENYENAIHEKDKSESSDLAQEYITHFLSNVPAPGITVEYELAKKILPQISLKEINTLPKQYITDNNCVIVITAPDIEKKFLPWENDILELVEKIKTDDINAYTDSIISTSLLQEKPKGSKIMNETKNEKYNITYLELKNGIKIVLKPTFFKNDEILMTSFSPGGTSLYSDEDFMSADYSNAIVAASGVSNFNIINLQKMLSGITAGVYPYVGELNEGFKGSSNKKDVETMLQLVYLYFTQPRKSLSDYNSFMTKQKGANEHILDNPSAFFIHKFQNIIYNNSIRRGLTTVDKLEKVDFEKAFQIYKERFNDAADFTFLFVGNIDIKKIKPLLETYLGALPTNGNKETWKDPEVNKKSGIVTSKNQVGITQKSLVGIHFHGKTEWTEDNDFTFDAMLKVLNIQLREAIREDKGGVYGVGVNGFFAERPKNAYGITIQFNTEINRMEELKKAVYDNIDSLKTNGPTALQVKKIQESLKRERESIEKENEYWLSTLQYIEEFKKDFTILESFNQKVETLTIQKIKDAFIKYFDIKNHIEVILEPVQ